MFGEFLHLLPTNTTLVHHIFYTIYDILVNLGQGFPNYPAAQFIKETASRAVMENHNQYAPSRGLPHLLKMISKTYGGYFKRSLDAEKEIMVSQGANQGFNIAPIFLFKAYLGIFAVLQTFLEPGDEVILIEPYFDIFKAAVEMCPLFCFFPFLNVRAELAEKWCAHNSDYNLNSRAKFQHLNGD